MYQLTALSASKIDLYLTCPFCWKCQYIDELIGIPSDALEIGILTHKGLEDYHMRLDPFANLKKELPVDSKEAIDKFGMIRRMIEGYILCYEKAPKTSPIKIESIKVEEFFRLEIMNSKGKSLPIPMSGKIDRTTHKGVIEYKTTAIPYTQKQVDESLQATIYAYAFKKLYSKAGTVTFVPLNKKEKDKEKLVQVLQTKRTQQDFDDMYNICEKTIENINAGKFEPNFIDEKNHRFWSQYRDICPACKKGN